jgi:hypothetical protein
MAGNVTDAVANDLLDVLLGAGANSVSPATVYAGLSTTAPADDGTGVTEPSGGAYARVAITNNATNFPTATARTKANGTAITFPTATSSWGTATHGVLFDAPTAGNVLAFGELVDPQEIITNGVPDFPVGTFEVTI